MVAVAFLATATFVSCYQNTAFYRYFPVNIEGWEKADFLEYSVPSVSLGGYYVEEIGVRTSRDYPYRQLSLAIQQKVISTTGEQPMRVKKDTIVILEGLHALNPLLLPDTPKEATFRIFVSPMTTVNLDNHNWIPTTDLRLIRRIVRDYRYRNYSARETIARCPSVRRGEEKWIYPFQENADVMFNSALLFELAVLKRHAEPILAEVPKYCDEYGEAHRMLNFLSYFESIPEREIPPTSFLREFVGGSSFRY